MAQYGVAEAKNNFTHLLERVENGETVTITRHGKPVAELRATPKLTLEERRAFMREFAARRKARPPLGMTAVELLNSVYDEPTD